MPVTYAESGVDISAADSFVRRIGKAVRSTYTPAVLGDIGAFGGFFEARFPRLKSPVLVSSVDGVGTKVLIAQMLDRHDTVGQDLVNHCVNDILACGASPLFFLDYFAAGRLRPQVSDALISGFVRACRANGCALIGGETAEMPGLYDETEYDLAGMIVGVVEKRRILGGQKVKKGDVLVGLASHGLHTNGYSLARAVLLKQLHLHDYVEELGDTLGNALMRVHRSYLHPVSELLDTGSVHAISHITGGGIEGNTFRVVPKGRGLKIDWGAWERPPLFRLIQTSGDVPEEEMRKTFNLGVGLILVVDVRSVDSVLQHLKKKKEDSWVMGEIV